MFFVSSYIPLYVLLIIKNILERCTDGGRFNFTITKLISVNYFDEINDYAITLLILLSVISLLYMNFLEKKEGDKHYYEIVSVQEQTTNVYFNYISVYFLSCLGLSLNNIVDVFVLFFLMVLVGCIYIPNRLMYMNPVLQLWGYKIYEGEIKSKSTGEVFQSVVIVKKKSITPGESYAGSGKEDFIFLQENVD